MTKARVVTRVEAAALKLSASVKHARARRDLSHAALEGLRSALTVGFFLAVGLSAIIAPLVLFDGAPASVWAIVWGGVPFIMAGVFVLVTVSTFVWDDRIR